MQGKFSKYTSMIWWKGQRIGWRRCHYANYNMGSGLNHIILITSHYPHHIIPITSTQISVSEYTGINVSSDTVFNTLWKVWSFTSPPPHLFRNGQKYFLEKLKGRCTILTYCCYCTILLKRQSPLLFHGSFNYCVLKYKEEKQWRFCL